MANFPAPADSESIVKASGSNLAFAFSVLPKEKRADMRVFYAFCRVVDDVVDDGNLEVDEQRRRLQAWRDFVTGETLEARPGLEAELRDLQLRYALPEKTMLEIIDGMEMDLQVPVRYETFDELKKYCHRAASAVGLVSIEIFGYEREMTREYAELLGYALQLTNILRDVAEDAQVGRIYLPREDMQRFAYTEQDLLAGKYDARFFALADFLASRAEDFYAEAEAMLPEVDREAMKCSELMRVIYKKLLAKMKADQFRVFDQRYRLSKWELMKIVGQGMVGRIH
ncbi:MAG: presqualene diphosphate synthase HpnD [Verrucomicrobiales bacterium]|nr:presqualene diphosphate synthase HpnD [Verrucomicrobiales bacterium]